MKYNLLLVFAFSTLGWAGLRAQIDQPASFGKGSTLFQHDRITFRGSGDFINPDWAPFYHGVASGDPLSDRVILWTRVTPENTNTPEIQVDWRLATDPELSNVIISGTYTTAADRDYTVKVEVTGLSPGTTYFYGFSALDKHSLTGKTKTTPIAGNIDHFKFGVVSCSNYQAGYFNAYARLAERTDLDAIIHLGDYIYEYGNRVYGSNVVWEDRPLEPEYELLSLEDYRTRYSTYRLDTNLIRLHQQYPFITIWDDHESANDSYVDGSENHSETSEGSWTDRKNHSKQAYFEWMPIRDNTNRQVYRTIQYGDLMDLILLDTRLEGREKQINDITDPVLHDPDRTILGKEQKAWLFGQLANSTARWKILGQQVIFAQFNVGWASSLVDSTYESVESAFLDIWDGYPAERSQIVSFLKDQDIDNVVILTGDFHSSFAFDIADPPVDINLQEVSGLGPQPFYRNNVAYDPLTGAGSAAVEFATPSITSANFDENSSPLVALALQLQINQEVNILNNTVNLGNPNPHMKYVDLIRHGYFILDVKPDSVQANWYYVPIMENAAQEAFGGAYYTRIGENHLRAAAAASGAKALQDIPAPPDPPNSITSTRDLQTENDLLVVSAYPNPAQSFIHLHYVLNRSAALNIGLYAENGQLIRKLLSEKVPGGIYTLYTDTGNLPSGVYYYQLQTGKQVTIWKFVKQ